MEVFLSSYGAAIVQMALAGVLALSLYLPLMAGQLSLASPGFYAVGGYTAALLSTTVFTGYANGSYPIPLIVVEMVIAGGVSALFALIIGIPSLRLRGIYLALATIAFIEILRVFALNQPWLGGAVGIYNIPQPFFSATRIEYLLLALPLLFGAMFFVARLERSRVGRAFIALREDELAASAMGVRPTYYKVLAFTLGAVLAGMAGALNAHILNTWNARQGTFDLSILILAYVLVGGSRTFLGPVIGGAFLVALPEIILREIAGAPGLNPVIATFLRDGRLILFGVLIAVSVFFFPYGLITPELFKRRRKKPEKVTVEAAKPTPNVRGGNL
ncbi:MAG: branched-chain amino acid ABC transporter permease [Chloroflexi bacterium CFX4]|nr:branched-chain amino acid ABC transporter permease [Chloroflexi bacterium CFX4]MDL1922319.1 branched-chain amino acid ABC transporter permease [Chloroflexi bacterium CFX3]